MSDTRPETPEEWAAFAKLVRDTMGIEILDSEGRPLPAALVQADAALKDSMTKDDFLKWLDDAAGFLDR
jgi:hypothetical protein